MLAVQVLQQIELPAEAVSVLKVVLEDGEQDLEVRLSAVSALAELTSQATEAAVSP